MSMTREEKIKRLKALKARCERLIASSDRGPEEWRKDAEALDLALAALRGPTREMVEEVWRGCYTCDEYKYFMFNAWTNPESSERPDCMGTSLFCPQCGKPLTDEAVDIVMRRLEAVKDGKGD